MPQIIKYVLGIDVSKDTIDVCFGSIDNNQSIKLSVVKRFKNNDDGFEKLIIWINPLTTENVPVWFVMEATGVYFENLAYYLAENNQNVNVILPTKMKHYIKSTEIKSKTDRIDARAITRLGLERQLEKWNVPIKHMKTIKELTREHKSLNDIATQVKNQIHAKQSSHHPNPTTLKRFQKHLSLLEKQQNDIVKELKSIIKSMPEIEQKISLIEQSIKGVGFMTLITILAETNGFAFVTNAKQLTSFAGLDIVEDQSGKMKGATKISTKGNSHLRNVLYMPVLSVIRWVDKYKQFYIRLLAKGKVKKVGIIAVMRKLLSLIYSLWKNNEAYNPNYEKELLIKNV